MNLAQSQQETNESGASLPSSPSQRPIGLSDWVDGSGGGFSSLWSPAASLTEGR